MNAESARIHDSFILQLLRIVAAAMARLAVSRATDVPTSDPIGLRGTLPCFSGMPGVVAMSILPEIANKCPIHRMLDGQITVATELSCD